MITREEITFAAWWPLLTKVTAFSLRFYKNNEWQSEWLSPNELPAGVEVTLTLDDYGSIQQRFLLATPANSMSGSS